MTMNASRLVIANLYLIIALSRPEISQFPIVIYTANNYYFKNALNKI